MSENFLKVGQKANWGRGTPSLKPLFIAVNAKVQRPPTPKKKKKKENPKSTYTYIYIFQIVHSRFEGSVAKNIGIYT